VTLEEFATISRRVIARDGFERFAPTACYPARRHIAVLAGLSHTANLQNTAITWAIEKSFPDEEFLVAFKVSEFEFKIVRRHQGHLDEAVFAVT
jgi:hypothetical protein